MPIVGEIPGLVKRVYLEDASAIVRVVERNHPVFNSITRKRVDFGNGFYYPALVGNPQGVANQFLSAQANSTGQDQEQYVAQARLKYGVVQFSRPNVDKMTSKATFFGYVTGLVDSTLTQIGQDSALDLYRAGTGSRGRRLSQASQTITLTNRWDVIGFELGMRLRAGPNADGSSLRVGTGIISGINHDAGTITYTGTITAIADNDFLWRDGDVASGLEASIEGFDACTPLAAVTSTLFRGVDRTRNTAMLAGRRITTATAYADEQLSDLGMQMSTLAASCDMAAIHPVQFQQIVKRLGAKVEFQPGVDPKIFWSSCMVAAGSQYVKLMPDPYCPVDIVRCWKSSTHFIGTVGGQYIEPIRNGNSGDVELRMSGADATEVRFAAHGNYIQTSCKDHGVAALTVV